MFNTKDLLAESLKWYEKRFSIKDLKNASEIITPFVNHLNDRISLFVEISDNNEIRLSDDGITLNELELSGIDWAVPTRQRILKDIMKNYDLQLNDNVLFTVAQNQTQFAQKKYNLIQGILSIYDILFTSKNYATGIFNEEVLEYLFDNEFGGTPGPKLIGNSGLTHQLDYSLGATKKRPHILIKFLNHPNFTEVAAQKFISDDLKKKMGTQKISVKYVIIGNDKKNNIPEKSLIAAKDMGIDLVPWSDKTSILSLK